MGGPAIIKPGRLNAPELHGLLRVTSALRIAAKQGTKKMHAPFTHANRDRRCQLGAMRDLMSSDRSSVTSQKHCARMLRVQSEVL